MKRHRPTPEEIRAEYAAELREKCNHTQWQIGPLDTQELEFFRRHVVLMAHAMFPAAVEEIVKCAHSARRDVAVVRYNARNTETSDEDTARDTESKSSADEAKA